MLSGRTIGAGRDVAGLVLRRDGGAITPDAAARDHPRPRRAAAAGVGSRRRRAVSRAWQRAPRLLLDERRHDARLPVSLQLVREADLRPALHRAIGRAVVDEIAWLKRTYQPDHLWIADDIFGLKPGWIERFADLDRRAARGVPFKCLLRADGVTTAIARALKRAGCRTAWIGAESGRSASSTRWRRARASSRSPRRRAASAGGDRGRLLPAVRLPGRDARGHRADAADGARLPAGRHRRVGVVPAAGARRSTTASRRSSARSRTGSTRTISR